jgi:hypothetical protein
MHTLMDDLMTLFYFVLFAFGMVMTVRSALLRQWDKEVPAFLVLTWGGFIAICSAEYQVFYLLERVGVFMGATLTYPF